MSLTPEILLHGYSIGIFPMAEHQDDPEIFWVEPKMRGILPLDGFHISHSLAKRMRKTKLRVSVDQDFLGVVDGCANRIDTWINAEKLPNFTPCPGRISQYHAPGGLGVRMDSALYDGYSIPPYYDSLIGKLIVHGRDRPEALARLNRALGELIVDGVDTTVPLFHALLQEKDVLDGTYNIHWLEHWLESNLNAE